MSWTKTKVQNLRSGLPSTSLTVDGEVVEGVEEFVYLGSKQTSDGYCRPEIMRRIGLASAVMSSLRKVWNNRQLCVDTKVHVYHCTCAIRSALRVRDVDTASSGHQETWGVSLTVPETTTSCQPARSHHQWGDMQTNKTDVTQELVSRRRTSLFGHIARLDAAVPAHQALWQQTNISTGWNPGTRWKRLPGRPRKTWTSQIPDDTGMSSCVYWDASVRRRHERGMLRSEDYALMMMMDTFSVRCLLSPKAAQVLAIQQFHW